MYVLDMYTGICTDMHALVASYPCSLMYMHAQAYAFQIMDTYG